MTLKLNNKKRNPSTGKLQNTGTQTTVGLVSRGAAGGYSQGPINPGMVPVKTNPSGQQYYGYPQPQNIVPNSAPVAPLVPASFEQNFSLATGGTAYVPPPTASSSSKTSSPAPSAASSVTSPITAQGNSSNSTPPVVTRRVTITDKNGVSSSYDIDPRFSVISQTGSYEHPFWTSEGQKERLSNALETASFRTSRTGFAGESSSVAGTVATAAIDALNVASVLAGGAAVFKSITNWNKIGMLAAAPGGAEAIASNIPQAAGASTAAKVGAAAANTKNFGTAIKGLTSLQGAKGLLKLSAVGYVINKSLSGSEKINNEKTDFAKDSGELALKLREAGMTELADELNSLNKDLFDGIDALQPYIPFLGQPFITAKLDRDRMILNDMNLRYEAKVRDEQRQQLLEQQIAQQEADRVKREQDLQDQATQRQQQLEDQARKREQDLQDEGRRREQQLADRADSRAYEQLTNSLQYQQQAELDAVATQESPGSTLTFGLLGTGGATEFVDKDRAAQYYFKSDYEELTPAQKLLLNLLKGGN